MCQLVFVQLPLKPEGTAADVAVQLVRVVAVLGPLVLHAPPVTGKDRTALPPAGVGLDARVTVEVSLHVTVHEESLPTHITGVPHVTRVLTEMFLQMLLFSVLSFTAGKFALKPEIAGLHLLYFFPNAPSVTGVDVFSQRLTALESLFTRFVDTDVRLGVVMDHLEVPVHVVASGEGGSAALVGTVHHVAGQVVQLDVSDDEGGLDVLLTLGTLGIVPVSLDLVTSDLNDLALLTRGQNTVSPAHHLPVLLNSFQLLLDQREVQVGVFIHD